MNSWLDFHFLRPLWLLLLPLVVASYFYPSLRLDKRSSWAKIIEPHLLPYVLSRNGKKQKSVLSLLLLPLFFLLIVLALAGPTVNKLPTQTTYKKPPLIICLEVSQSMLATDVAPSRLKRAVFKLTDLMKLYQGGEIALIAFAGDAHVVVPLSDDSNTILTLAKSLHPDLMPIKGINIPSALDSANVIAKKYSGANIIVLASDVNASSTLLLDAIKQSYAPISFWTFKATKTEMGQHLAALNGATILPLTPDGRDVESIVEGVTSFYHRKSESEAFYDSFHDLGPYFLALAMLVMLVGFFFTKERWWILGLCLFILSPETKAWSWTDWLLRKDQQAQRALERGDAKTAAELFEGHPQKGSAFYKAQMYEKAAWHFKKVNTSDGYYNLGNTYAKLGQIEKAIESYDQALKLDQNNMDAKHNKELLEKLLKQENREEKSNDQEQKKEDNQQEDKKDQEQKERNQDSGAQEEQKKSQEKPKPKEQPEKSERSGKNASPKPDVTKDAKLPDNQEKKDISKETLYYFDLLEENNRLYLKRKFRSESERNQGLR